MRRARKEEAFEPDAWPETQQSRLAEPDDPAPGQSHAAARAPTGKAKAVNAEAGKKMVKETVSIV